MKPRCWAWKAATVWPGAILLAQRYVITGALLYLVWTVGITFGPKLLWAGYKRFRWMRRFDWNLDGRW